MSFTITEEKSFKNDAKDVFTAAVGAVGGLEGKMLDQDDAAMQLKAKFDKKILGKVLGDRTQIAVNVSSTSDNGGNVAIEVFPLDALGRKLQFGARKGVSRTVANWFWAHLEHRLPKD